MYNYTIQTIAFILLVSHTLMSCFNSELAIPSKEYSLEEQVNYLETSIDTQVITRSANVEPPCYDQVTNLQQPRLDIQLFTQGSTLNPSLIREQIPTSIADLQIDLPVLNPQILSPASNTKGQTISTPFIQSENPANPSLSISKRKSQQASGHEEKLAPTNSTKRIHKPHVRLQAFNQLQGHPHHIQAKRRSKKAEVIQEKHVAKEKLKKTKQTASNLPVVPRNVSLTYCFDKRIAVQRQLLNHLLQGNRQGHYQLARVQENLISFHQLIIGDRFLTAPIQIRGGHQVSFIQDAGFWWGILQENCFPEFSRTLILPVLYPQTQLVGLSRQLQYTVESLINASPEAQRQLLHVIFPEEIEQEIGFLYTGRAMGVVGGRWFSFICSSVASVVVSAAVGFWEGFKVGGPIGGIVGALGGAIGAIADCVRTYNARKKSRIELEGQAREANQLCEDAIIKAADRVKEIDQEINKNPSAYKRINDFLRPLLDYRGEIDLQIHNLKNWRKESTEENWFLNAGFHSKNFSVGFRLGSSLGGMDPTEKILWDVDLEYLEEQIRSREEDLKKIDRQIQEIKEKCREQACTALEKVIKEADDKILKCNTILGNSIAGIMTSGLDGLKKSFSALQNQILNNIEMYKEWKKEQALSDDLKKIDGFIDAEKAKLESEDMKLTKGLIELAEKNEENINRIQELTEADTQQDLINCCFNAIDDGLLALIYYAIKYKNVSPNSKEAYKGNTLLHEAVSANQPEIVEFLLQHEADPKDENTDKITPLVLAKDKPEIRKIFERFV